MAKDILVGFGVDVDAVAGWLGSYGGEDSPDDISRGLFAGEVASPRLLKLFERFGIKTTWFIPGHSIETFPKEMQAVANAGAYCIGLAITVHHFAILPEAFALGYFAYALDERRAADIAVDHAMDTMP